VPTPLEDQQLMDRVWAGAFMAARLVLWLHPKHLHFEVLSVDGRLYSFFFI
jgi:hypothetical protein